MKNIKKIAAVALLAAVISVAAPFAIPLGAVPITLATLAVYIAAQSVNCKTGVASVIIYILIGAVGVPVFSGFRGGVQHLLGATGGFVIGYIPCALVAGLAADKFEAKKLAYFAGNLAGTVLCYAFGTSWFMLVTKTGFAGAAAVCVLPFLPGDAIKIIAASLATPKIRAALKKQRT